MRSVKTLMRNTLIAGIVAVTPLFTTTVAAEEVYMIRGFADVYSTGINQMTARLKTMGIRATSHSTGDWRDLSRNILRRAKRGKVSYPIVIVGHSLGAVDAPLFANTLARGGVKVGLVIGLDPGFPVPEPFGRNVKQVINYKIPSGKHFRRGKAFNGKIKTIDVSRYGVDHVGIDKNPSVQGLVIRRIRAIVRK